MKNVNQRRKYVKMEFAPNGVIGTAAHQAVDVWKPTLGATIRTGGEIDLIKCNPQEKIDKNTRRMIRKASRIINNSKEGRAPTGTTQ
jgi:hypothetical protein